MKRRKNFVRNKPNTFVPSRVVGVRAEETFWDGVDAVAEKQGISRNGLIIKVMNEYIKNYGDNNE
jgi:predicted DNA-binding ribbon-helix-helix protein